MKITKFEQVLLATDIETVIARKNLNYKTLGLLPRDCWTLKLLHIGGCKAPRTKYKRV